MAPVCIVGMFRSGTSMVTRVLNLCGLYLGPETNILSPDLSNPKGFWENIYINKLNDAILAKLGGSWYLPPKMGIQGWEKHPNLELLRVKAKILFRQFSELDPWGWKDPRTSLTLPFWKSLISDIKIIVCVRHPWEVCQSVQNRYSSLYGLYLWKIYYSSILATTSADERIFTHFESYFNDWDQEVKRVTDFIGLSFSEKAKECIYTSIIPTLWHHRSNNNNFEISLPLDVIMMYNYLISQCDLKKEVVLKSKPRGTLCLTHVDYSNLLYRYMISVPIYSARSKLLFMVTQVLYILRRDGFISLLKRFLKIDRRP